MSKAQGKAGLLAVLLVSALLVSLVLLPQINQLTGFASVDQEFKIVVQKNSIAEINLSDYLPGAERTYLTTSPSNIDVQAEKNILVLLPDKDFTGERLLKVFVAGEDIQELVFRVEVIGSSGSVVSEVQEPEELVYEPEPSPELPVITETVENKTLERLFVSGSQVLKVDLSNYFESSGPFVAAGDLDLIVDIEDSLMTVEPYLDFVGEEVITVSSIGGALEEHSFLVKVSGGSAEDVPEPEILTEPAGKNKTLEPAGGLGEKIEDDPGFEVYFENTLIDEHVLVLEFYHDSEKPESIHIIGDVEYDLSTAKAGPDEIITAAIELIDGIVPEFELKVGDESEKFRFGSRLPKVSIKDAQVRYSKGFGRMIDVAVRKGSSFVKLHNVNSDEVKGVFLSKAADTEITGAAAVSEEPKIMTDIVSIDAEVSSATVVLEKSGLVSSIMKCDEFDSASGSCVAGWKDSGLAFSENETHVKFTVSEFSAYAGVLEVLNVQSYPVVGGNWEVQFITDGKDDLIITPVNTTWTEMLQDDPVSVDDLEFLEIKCGEQVIDKIEFTDETGKKHKLSQLGGESVRIKSLQVKKYECSEKGTIKNKVLTEGKHALEFRFGDTIEYAYNEALEGQNNLANADFSYDGVELSGFSGITLAQGDLDGDGIDDIVIGAPPFGGEVPPGHAYIFYGPVPQLTRHSLGNADATITEENARDIFSSALCVGDLDNDGYDDIFAGAYGYPEGAWSGRGYLFYGSNTRLSGSISAASADAVWDSDDILGMHCDTGELTGDVYEDVIVSSYGSGFNGAGSTYLLAGSATKYSGTYDLTLGQYTAKFNGENNLDEALRIAAVGDVNDDGIGDFAIGAPGYLGADKDGRVYLFYGSSYSGEYSVASANRIYTPFGTDSVQRFGAQVAAAGDHDGDGIDDWMFSSPYKDDEPYIDRGAVYFIYGSSAPHGSADAAFLGEASNYYLGDVMLSTGDMPLPGTTLGYTDLNNDGYDDICFGARVADISATDDGELTCVYGSSTRYWSSYPEYSVLSAQTKDLGGDADVSWTAETAAGDGVGSISRDSGDYNDDGLTDLLIGAWHADYGGADTGSTYGILGTGPPSIDLIELQSSGGDVVHAAVDENLFLTVDSSDPGGSSTTEIISWYKNGVGVENLILPFDTNDMSNTRDYSANAFDGIINGAAWVSGISGGAYDFNGGSNYIDLGSVSLNLGSEFTISAWISAVSDRTDYRVIISKGEKNTGHWEVYLAQNTGELRFYSPDLGDFGSGSILDDGLWHYIAITYNGAEITFYVDGDLATSSPATGTVQDETETVYVGRQADTLLSATPMYFFGKIDDIRIYTAALSSSQIGIIGGAGTPNHKEISSEETTSGDTWYAEAVPNNGAEDGNIAASNTLTVQNAEGVCNDGLDGDGDGFTDCLDPDCNGLNSCEYGTEVTCNDGFDNDADSLADCLDDNCDGLEGGAPGELCEFDLELSCEDNFDNDGDGLIDVADPDCEIVEITVLTTALDFGTLGTGGLASCTIDTESPPGTCTQDPPMSPGGIEIQNTGNVVVEAEVRAGKDASEFIGGTSPEYKWKCTGSGTSVISSWQEITPDIFISCITGMPVDGLSAVQLRVVIPQFAPAGSKSDIITVQAVKS